MLELSNQNKVSVPIHISDNTHPLSYYPESMRILSYPATSPNSGITSIRIALPHIFAATISNGLSIISPIFISEKLTSKIPIFKDLIDTPPGRIVLQQQSEKGQYESILESKNLFPNANLVCDLDDLSWKAPLYNAKKWDHKRIKEFYRNLNLCSEIRLSTPYLMEQVIKKFGGNFEYKLMPNLVYGGFIQRPEVERGKMRILVSGQANHIADFDVLYNVIEETQFRYEWIGYGQFNRPFYGLKMDFVDPTPGDKYFQTLYSILPDVCCIPLHDHEFNDCISNLKFLEYGRLGIPSITSDRVPYRKCPSIKIRSGARETRQWINALKEMENESVRKEFSNKTIDYVSHFMAQNNLGLVMDGFYGSRLKEAKRHIVENFGHNPDGEECLEYL